MTMFDYLIPAVSTLLLIYTVLSVYTVILAPQPPHWKEHGPIQAVIQGKVITRLLLLGNWGFLAGIVFVGFSSGEYHGDLNSVWVAVSTTTGLVLAIGGFLHRIAWLVIFELEGIVNKSELSHNRKDEVQ